MNQIEIFTLKQIGKAIKELDQFTNNEQSIGNNTNIKRLDTARKNLINILFSKGYELEAYTYRVIKSTTKRKLTK